MTRKIEGLRSLVYPVILNKFAAMIPTRSHVLQTVPAIQDCLLKHESCYQGIEGFKDQVAVFRRLAERALARKQREGRDTALSPESAGLIQALLVVSGPLEAWAAIIGEEVVRCQAGAQRRELRAMGSGLSGHAQALSAIGAEAIKQGASHYGLTSSMLDDLNERIRAYDAASCEGVPTLRSATDQLSFFLRDVMDPLVRGFLIRAPEFCADYRKARKGNPATERGTLAVGQDAVLNA
jgi:hypothetical protein